jgi:leucyl aminopeptidase
VNQDALPADLDAVISEGAKASRFTGKAGQIFEAFASFDGIVTRIALVGLGEAASATRSESAEKAGAAISAKYLASGETALTLDLAGPGL